MFVPVPVRVPCACGPSTCSGPYLCFLELALPGVTNSVRHVSAGKLCVQKWALAWKALGGDVHGQSLVVIQVDDVAVAQRRVQRDIDLIKAGIAGV